MSNQMSVDPIVPVEMTVMDNSEAVISQIETDHIIQAVSPTMTVEVVTGGVLVTVTDKNGTTTATILNGVDGQNGQDGQDGADGQDGVGISSIVLNGDYTLTINYTDGNSTTTASIRGETGATGQTGPAGANAYVHIKYSATQPTQDSDMKDTADAWMGIYSGSSSTAPTAYTSYTWYKIKGEDGAGAVAAVKMNGSTIQPDQNHIVDLGTVITSHQDISGKVDKNQGSTYAGKVLGIGNDGMVTPVPFSGDDFTGATASTAGVHGYVPAPSAGDQDLVLTGGGTWEESPGAKVVEVTGTITNTSGAYSGSISDQRVVSGMKLVGYELGTPTVFNANIEIAPGSGSVAIACSDVAGTSTIKIKLLKVMDDPTTMTSAEFDILDNRIGDLTDLDTTAKTDIVSAINEHESDISTLNSKLTRTQLVYNTTLLTSHEYGLNDSVENYDYIEITFGKSGYGSFMSRIIPNSFLKVGSIDTISLSVYNNSTYNAYIECGFPTNNKFRMPTIVQNGWTITPLSIYGIGKRT